MRIVVADDSAFIRNIVKRALESNKESLAITDLTLCESGLTALEHIKSHEVDWLVTDLLMPEMTGQELIKNINELEKNIKIVVVSADVQQGTKDELKSLGVARYLNKPLSPDKIERLLEMLKGEADA